MLIGWRLKAQITLIELCICRVVAMNAAANAWTERENTGMLKVIYGIGILL